MKKQLFALMLVVSISTVQLYAQDQNTMTTLPTVTITSGTVVNKEITKAFKKAFPNANLLDWYELNKMYMVKFIENDVKHHVLITKKGSIKYDISFGNKKNLSEEISRKVLSNYSEYDISGVTNVKEDGRDIWVINLENPKHIVFVRYENDELEETSKYDKDIVRQ